MNKRRVDIKNIIRELCNEDDYGSWELWWAATGNNQGISLPLLRVDFLICVQELINEHEIVSKIKGSDCQFSVVPFSKNLLLQQISATQPDPDSDYWFGIPEA